MNVRSMRETVRQASRYLIGAFIALAVDATIVSVGVKSGAPVIAARMVALLAGVTITYFFNRRYTFATTGAATLADWGRYVLAQSLGSALNFAVSTGLLYLSDRTLWQIWGSVLVGAAVGFCVNFFSARRMLQR